MTREPPEGGKEGKGERVQIVREQVLRYAASAGGPSAFVPTLAASAFFGGVP